MAHYCTYCEYLFDRPRSACPYCGGIVTSDDQPDAALLAQGYSDAPGLRPAAAGGAAAGGTVASGRPAAAAGASDVASDSGAADYYESLLSDFEGRANGASGAQNDAFGQRTAAGGAVAGSQAPSSVREHPITASVIPDVGDDFFASFTDQTDVAVPERVEAPAGIAQARIDTQVDEELDRRARELRNERRRQRVADGASAAGRGISWLFGSTGPIARFIRVCLAVFAIAVVLWLLRDLIVGGFMWVLSTIVPIALVIYVCYRLIRGR